MSEHHDWTVAYTESGFRAVPLRDVESASKPVKKSRAVADAERANAALATVDVAERFGPGEVAA